MHYDLTGFGTAAKKFRIEKGIKIIDLKELCNINRDTIRKIENGMVIPKIETLDRLSYVYKQDMYMLFSKYRLTVDVYLNKVIHKISKSFKTKDFEIMDLEIKKFKETYENSPIYGDAIIKKKVNQLKLYLYALVNIDKIIIDESRKVITDLFLSLECSNKDLIKKKVRFDKIETRIIILLATVYRFKNDFIRSIDLLEIARDELLSSFRHDSDFLKLYILVSYNIMTHYHRSNKYTKSLEVYRDSLKIIDNEVGIYNLAYYTIRVGLDKYLSGDLIGYNFLITGLNLLKDNDDNSHFELISKSLKKNYPDIDFKI